MRRIVWQSPLAFRAVSVSLLVPHAKKGESSAVSMKYV